MSQKRKPMRYRKQVFQSSILRIKDFLNQELFVQFQGGRTVKGLVKGFDNSKNLVLDECFEQIQDKNDPNKLTDKTRKLGLVIIRGALIVSYWPVKGFKEIENPFEEEQEEEM